MNRARKSVAIVFIEFVCVGVCFRERERERGII